MNIFFLNRNPKLAAQAMYDYHCQGVMVKECAQLLSSAHWYRAEDDLQGIYKPSHLNHPCALWVRKSREHYYWLYAHAMELVDEYHWRFESASDLKAEAVLANLDVAPRYIRRKTWEDPPQVLPEEDQVEGDALFAYRRNYIKRGMARASMAELYKKSTWGPPSWWTPGLVDGTDIMYREGMEEEE